MDGFFTIDSDHIPPPLPCTDTAALVPYTPPGTRRGPDRSRITRPHPDRIGPTRIAMADSAQADSDPFTGHILARFGPTRITGRTLGSCRLGSQLYVTRTG